MDVFIIGDTGEKIEPLDELRGKSLADDIAFIAEDDKTPCELLAECIYEDFVKAR
jgi:hypothetical protein